MIARPVESEALKRLTRKLYFPSRWAELFGPLTERLYRSPPPLLTNPIDTFGVFGDGVNTPIACIVSLNVGWIVRPVPGLASHDQELNVLRQDGKNVTVAFIRGALRRETVRCYCDRCCSPHRLDDEETARLRTVLELRRNIARANGIPVDGEPENETRIDEVINNAVQN